jgi:hypothetical protein
MHSQLSVRSGALRKLVDEIAAAIVVESSHSFKRNIPHNAGVGKGVAGYLLRAENALENHAEPRSGGRNAASLASHTYQRWVMAVVWVAGCHRFAPCDSAATRRNVCLASLFKD